MIVLWLISITLAPSVHRLLGLMMLLITDIRYYEKNTQPIQLGMPKKKYQKLVTDKGARRQKEGPYQGSNKSPFLVRGNANHFYLFIPFP